MRGDWFWSGAIGSCSGTGRDGNVDAGPILEPFSSVL